MGAVWALGAMSGTSLDGVDAALLLSDGRRIEAMGRSAYRAYAPAERDVLRAALGRWPGEAGVGAAAEVVERAHAEVMGPLAGEAALLGLHGQTVAHDAAGGRTHQLGCGARLAQALGRPVAWDFRSADMAAGGQGAPFAPAYHHACARWAGAGAPVAILNLGGVGNLTWADPRREVEAPGALLAFDTGPANAPIDDICAHHLGRPYDDGGGLARRGRADGGLVAAFLADPYFAAPPPKSLDRDAFAEGGVAIDALPPADAAATWVAVVAATAARALTLAPAMPERLLVTGGGRRNPAIMAALAQACPCPVAPVEEMGLDGDMLEAQAFAFLAVRVRAGLPLSFPGTTGVAAPQTGGRIAHPSGAAVATP
jgi:anhydro-N-acetylmuramic acid kinase